MALNPDAVGTSGEPVEMHWTTRDTMLYALGVGAGIDELEFTTENTAGRPLRTLPTFPVVIGSGAGGRPDFGSYELARLLHGTQKVTIHRELPPEGSAIRTTRVAAIWDKQKAAVVELESTAVDADGAPWYTVSSGLFIKGEGGWGGDRGPAGPVSALPDRTPDHVVEDDVAEHQALIYRLSGDHNPLHSDPTFASSAGFDRPILHGLCTFGYTGRALLHSVAGSDPAKVRSIEGRFASPTYPGERLTVSIWRLDERSVAFTTSVGDRVVFDRGMMILA